MAQNVIKTISLPRDLVEFVESQDDLKLSKYIQEQLKNERRLREGRTLQIDKLKAELDATKKKLALTNSFIFQENMWGAFDVFSKKAEIS